MKQFDVEQGILECWRVTDDIRLVYDAIGSRDVSEDEMMNLLLGMEALYQLKFDKLFNDFEQLGNEIARLKNGRKET